MSEEILMEKLQQFWRTTDRRLFQVSRYTYYFALVYLGIEYLAKAMTQDAVKNQSKESKLMQDVKKQ